MKYENIADDVWSEIFLHLPLNAIFKFKGVSKVWILILSNPNFLHKWYKLNYLSLPWMFGHAVYRKDSEDNRLSIKFKIASLELHSQFTVDHQNGFSFGFLNSAFPNSSNEEEKINLFLFSSSNGLVFCRAKNLSDQSSYYVCNPLTEKWVLLPPPPLEKFRAVSGLICNECFESSSPVSASYKVIRIGKFEGAVKEFKVQVFSSDLGEWSIYDVSCGQDVRWDLSLYDNFVTGNGVFYWFQKANSKILAVSIDRNEDDGTFVNECSLINLPGRAVDGDRSLRHCLGESEGLICYAVVKERERSLSLWVLEQDWCLLYTDNTFHDKLSEMETTFLIGGVGTDDFSTKIQVIGFSPVDKKVVILGYRKYIWAYNVRTKGCKQLSHPSFMDSTVSHVGVLAFALKPRPTILLPIS